MQSKLLPLSIAILLGVTWVSLSAQADGSLNDHDRDGVVDAEDLDPSQPRYHIGTGSIGALGFCVHDDNGLNCDGVRNSSGDLSSLYQPPTEASSWKDIIDFDAGWDDVACVIRVDHELICWGPKYTGASNDWVLPQVLNPVKIDVGGNYLCAVGEAGDGVHCFDPSFRGFETYDDPANIEDFYDPDWDECISYNEEYGYCEYQRAYSPYESFRGNKTAVNAEALALTGVTDVSTGQRDTCAIHDAGVFCWGTRTMDVELGLSGNPPPESYGLNVIPRVLSNPRSLSLGDANACLIDDLGLVCWGTQTNPIVADMPTASEWSGLNNPSKVRVGNSGACVLHDDGLTCWGTGPLTLPPTGGLPQNILDFETNISGSAICVSTEDEFQGKSVRCWSAQNANFDHLMVGLAYGDPDGDQLNEIEEAALGTLALDPDTDDDGLLDNVDPNPVEETDSDSDEIPDSADNCPNTSNAVQEDLDADGEGDACDSDIDGDGSQNAFDNCPLVVNVDQLNTDADAEGDVCDNDGLDDLAEMMVTGTSPLIPDTDGDGVLDGGDLFPLNHNEWSDIDADSIGNNSDNCIAVMNIDQVDLDSDGAGDACDTDDDGDGVIDLQDAFPLDGSESDDSDTDGIGDNSDNCSNIANPNQDDFDADNEGDVCDVDDDNDGVIDTVDAFPRNPNEQLDTDSDGVGNSADSDDDGDGAVDVSDAFPLNPLEQLDTDVDGIGNNADPDDDNDLVEDALDAFPLDSSEAADTDFDGVGNNADSDDDNDSLLDSEDAYPQDSARHGTVLSLGKRGVLSNAYEPVGTYRLILAGRLPNQGESELARMVQYDRVSAEVVSIYQRSGKLSVEFQKDIGGQWHKLVYQTDLMIPSSRWTSVAFDFENGTPRRLETLDQSTLLTQTSASVLFGSYSYAPGLRIAGLDHISRVQIKSPVGSSGLLWDFREESCIATAESVFAIDQSGNNRHAILSGSRNVVLTQH